MARVATLLPAGPPASVVRSELEPTDERFYHVGLGLSLLDQDCVLYHPAAFSVESQREIERGFRRPIAVVDADATTHFVCNTWWWTAGS